MAEPAPKPIRPNTVAWAIVQILADGHWRGGSDVRWRLECAGVAFGSAATVRAELGRLCRRQLLDRRRLAPRNQREFRLKAITFDHGATG